MVVPVPLVPTLIVVKQSPHADDKNTENYSTAFFSLVGLTDLSKPATRWPARQNHALSRPRLSSSQCLFSGPYLITIPTPCRDGALKLTTESHCRRTQTTNLANFCVNRATLLQGNLFAKPTWYLSQVGTDSLLHTSIRLTLVLISTKQEAKSVTTQPSSVLSVFAQYQTVRKLTARLG